MKKYNDHLQAFLKEKQIFNQVKTLATKITGAMLAKQEHNFEQIDKEITKGKIQAEKQCRKIKAGKYGWTLELNKAIQMVLYWKGIEKRQNGEMIGKDILIHCRVQGGITHTPTNYELVPAIIKSNIQHAYQYLHRLQADKARRQHWLSQLIAAQAEQEQQTKKAYGKDTR